MYTLYTTHLEMRRPSVAVGFFLFVVVCKQLSQQHVGTHLHIVMGKQRATHVLCPIAYADTRLTHTHTKYEINTFLYS